MKSGKIMVIGSSNTDMTIKAKSLPMPGETVSGGEFTMGPGGKGANQAVAAKRLGAEVAFVCKTGRDIFGDNAVRHYEAEGLDTSLVMRSEKPSGIALITVDENAENCIAVASGANDDISVADIEAIGEDIRNASILLLQLEIPVPAVMKAAEIASEAGVFTILNPAPACSLPEEIFRNISLIIPNRTETGTMTGITVSDKASLDKAVGKLREMGVGNVIVTLGSEGSAIYGSGAPEYVDAIKVDAVDTTAAGDTFCGALAVAINEGKSLREAVEFATKASSLTVQRMGAQASIPYRNEL